jgi:hypothetical protein
MPECAANARRRRFEMGEHERRPTDRLHNISRRRHTLASGDARRSRMHCGALFVRGAARKCKIDARNFSKSF